MKWNKNKIRKTVESLDGMLEQKKILIPKLGASIEDAVIYLTSMLETPDCIGDQSECPETQWEGCDHQERCNVEQEKIQNSSKFTKIYDETGIDNPDTIIRMLNEWLQLKQLTQSLPEPEHALRVLITTFKNKREVKR